MNFLITNFCDFTFFVRFTQFLFTNLHFQLSCETSSRLDFYLLLLFDVIAVVACSIRFCISAFSSDSSFSFFNPFIFSLIHNTPIQIRTPIFSMTVSLSTFGFPFFDTLYSSAQLNSTRFSKRFNFKLFTHFDRRCEIIHKHEL